MEPVLAGLRLPEHTSSTSSQASPEHFHHRLLSSVEHSSEVARSMAKKRARQPEKKRKAESDQEQEEPQGTPAVL